jgi:hypothetical protein
MCTQPHFMDDGAGAPSFAWLSKISSLASSHFGMRCASRPVSAPVVGTPNLPCPDRVLLLFPRLPRPARRARLAPQQHPLPRQPLPPPRASKKTLYLLAYTRQLG